MQRTTTISMAELDADIEIEIEYDFQPGDQGDRTTPPVGAEVYITHCWIGNKVKGVGQLGDNPEGAVDIVRALDSLGISLADSVYEQIAEESEEWDEPDPDDARERMLENRHDD
jgi:hypothetical protein